MPERDIVKTGIDGLDEIMSGGILRGNVVLVEGAAGTGKTTLGMEFVYRGATVFNEPGLIVLFEVSPDKLIRDAALFGWDLPELERRGRLKIVFTTREVFQQEIQQADSLLLDEAAAIGARRIFVDGLVRRTPTDNDAGRNTHEAFHLLAEGLQRERLTAMLGVEVASAGSAGLGTWERDCDCHQPDHQCHTADGGVRSSHCGPPLKVEHRSAQSHGAFVGMTKEVSNARGMNA